MLTTGARRIDDHFDQRIDQRIDHGVDRRIERRIDEGVDRPIDHGILDPVDRRIVDIVQVGTADSETRHGYVGEDAVAGNANGQTFRQARGWMRYALTTFDDTEVTVALTFANGDAVGEGATLHYEMVVEDSLIATRSFTASPSSPPGSSSVVEIAVPFVLTKGKTNIAVIIRAREGPTPALLSLRTIQDHNEVQQFAVTHVPHSLGAPR